MNRKIYGHSTKEDFSTLEFLKEEEEASQHLLKKIKIKSKIYKTKPWTLSKPATFEKVD
ncbi:hypothetical protein [Metabacillus fastidiosus]|uniref:hypothetical protein n=1 Tax=Metabacillus fastidiosus TaxID=1458 RepID=UPI003D283CC3